MNAGGDDAGSITPLDQIVIRVSGIGPFKPAAVPQAEGAAREERQPSVVQPLTQPTAGREQGLGQGLIGTDRGRDVFQVPVIRFGDEVRELLHHLTGNTDVGAVWPTCEQLDLETFQK